MLFFIIIIQKACRSKYLKKYLKYFWKVFAFTFQESKSICICISKIWKYLHLNTFWPQVCAWHIWQIGAHHNVTNIFLFIINVICESIHTKSKHYSVNFYNITAFSIGLQGQTLKYMWKRPFFSPFWTLSLQLSNIIRWDFIYKWQ